MHRSLPTLAVAVLLAGLAGCHHEELDVPVQTELRDHMNVQQTYALRHKTDLDPLNYTDERPYIDEWYWAGQLPPAEAFERLPFAIDAPEADSISVISASLTPGTAIAITLVDVYDTCHVYFGRILTGDARNSHLLLVVPSKSGKVASVDELNHTDAAYLLPVTRPTTGPMTVK